MLTSLEILLKVLQLNKILFTILAVFFLPGGFLSSQENTGEGNIAVLLEGPLNVNGVPGIGDNVIPCFRGRYQLNGNEIEVYYTTEEIPVFDEWNKVSINSFSFYSVNENILCYINSGRWALFIEYKDPDDYSYDFAAELTRKMIFFAKTEEFFKVSSFPAIIIIKR